MGKGLNDNFQEALQFLTLGAGIILGTRLAYLGGLTLLTRKQGDTLHESLRPFGHGYLLPDADIWVVQSMNVGGRVALALALAITMAILMALIAGVIARLLNKAALPMAIAAGRSGLLIGAIWGLFAAVAVPPSSARMNTDGIILESRPALFGELSLPLPARTTTVPWDDRTSVDTRSVPTRSFGCGTMEEVVLERNGQTYLLGQLRPEGRDCEEALRFARAHTGSLAALLDSIRSR